MKPNEQVTQAIDKAICDYMKAEGVNQTQLAATLDMSTNTLRSKRRGSADWSWSEVLTLSRLTGLTPNELSGIKLPITA